MTKVPTGKPVIKKHSHGTTWGAGISLQLGNASCRIWGKAISAFLSFFSVGPLHSDLEYTVSSQKEGYVLTAVEGTIGDFKAYALAGVSFEVTLFLKSSFIEV